MRRDHALRALSTAMRAASRCFAKGFLCDSQKLPSEDNAWRLHSAARPFPRGSVPFCNPGPRPAPGRGSVPQRSTPAHLVKIQIFHHTVPGLAAEAPGQG